MNMGTTPVCAYCWKEWPKHKGAAKDLPDDIAKEIREHVQVCDKNPLVQQVKQLQAENEAASKLCEIYFAIAENALGEDEVRIQRDIALKGSE